MDDDSNMQTLMEMGIMTDYNKGEEKKFITADNFIDEAEAEEICASIEPDEGTEVPEGAHFCVRLDGTKVMMLPGDQEMVRVIAEEALGAFGKFQLEARAVMTGELATLIKRQRVDLRQSWRKVGGYVCQLRDRKVPDGSGLLGMAMCQAAADLLGEEWTQSPWN